MLINENGPIVPSLVRSFVQPCALLSSLSPWLLCLWPHQLVVPTPLPLATPSRGDIYTTRNASVPLAALASIALPSGYVPLVLNTLTQIVCVSGVHRLTARVSSLTVTLVLVVRKAVSMLISVVLFGQRAGEVDARLMWAGAALVFLGTMGYGAGSRRGKVPVEKTKKE